MTDQPTESASIGRSLGFAARGEPVAPFAARNSVGGSAVVGVWLYHKPRRPQCARAGIVPGKLVLESVSGELPKDSQ